MDITNHRKEKIKFMLCGQNTCCPVLTEVDDNKFTLTDDYEGEVVLTKTELVILKNFLNDNIKD